MVERKVARQERQNRTSVYQGGRRGIRRVNSKRKLEREGRAGRTRGRKEQQTRGESGNRKRGRDERRGLDIKFSG